VPRCPIGDPKASEQLAIRKAIPFHDYIPFVFEFDAELAGY